MSRSYTMVVMQLLAVGFLLLTGPLLARPEWIWLEIAGLYLGLWAVLRLRPRSVRVVLPDVPRNAPLVTRGPYRWIRHPMYTAVLLITLAVVLS